MDPIDPFLCLLASLLDQLIIVKAEKEKQTKEIELELAAC